MATRYNAFGWYNPYAPVSGGGVSTDGGEQPLKGLVVPVTAGPTWRVESDLNQGFVEVKNDGKLYATSPMAATTSVAATTPVAATTTTTTTTTNGASNISTTDTSVLLLASAEKSKFRSVGIAFCILSSFTLGIVVSYLAVDIGDTSCVTNKKTATNRLHEFYYWAPRVAPLPLPIFTFVIGILCIVIRERSGGQARTIYAISIFCFVLLLPLLLAGGIGGIIEAQYCAKAAIEVIYLVLPAILLLMFLIFFALLVYLVLLLIAVKPATTSTAPLSTTTVTVTTPVISTGQPTPPPVQPPVQQPPNQPVIIQVAGPPAYRPLPSYQVIAPRYPAPRPPPAFGMAQYGRPPMRSPYGNYGYSPFRAPQIYRPYSYY